MRYCTTNIVFHVVFAVKYSMSLSLNRPPSELPETPLASLLNDVLFELFKNEQVKMRQVLFKSNDFQIHYYNEAPVFVHAPSMGWQLAYRVEIECRQGRLIDKVPWGKDSRPVHNSDSWLNPLGDAIGLMRSPDKAEGDKNYQDRMWFSTALAAWQAHAEPFSKRFGEYKRGLVAIMEVTNLLFVAASCKLNRTITTTDKMAVKSMPEDLGFKFLKALLHLEENWHELATSPALKEEAFRKEVKLVPPSPIKRV